MNAERVQVSHLQIEDQERVEFILKSISTYSPSGRESSFANLIRNELSSHGLNPRIDSVGNVICEAGSGDVSLLLCGHMDTVPGELPVKKDDAGQVYGRGACDAKGPLLSLLFAFEKIVSLQFPNGGRVVFAAVTEEEMSSAGLTQLINSKVVSDYAIFGEPGGLSRVTVGYRGHVTARMEVVTPEVHASAPKLTTNANELMFEVYNAMKRDLDAVDSRSTDKVSVSMTKISGGSAHNVIPGRVSATIDIRVPFGHSTASAKETIARTAERYEKSTPNARITVAFDEPTEPYRVRLDSPLVRAMNRSILRTVREKPSLVTKSGTGDMNTYALTFGIDALTYGPGDAKLSHTSEEKVSLSEIFSCSSVVVNAAMELFAMEKNISTRKECIGKW